MSFPTAPVASLQAAVEEHSRVVFEGRGYFLPGHETSPNDWPEAVRSAQAFHAGILHHGEVGDALVRRLTIDLGGGWLLVAHHSESGWGVVEVYTLHGELLAAGIYFPHGLVTWQDLSVVRQSAEEGGLPFHLIPKDTPLKWVTHGSGPATQYESVGGRFFIGPTNPFGDANQFLLIDGLTKIQQPYATADIAKAQALSILTES